MVLKRSEVTCSSVTSEGTFQPQGALSRLSGRRSSGPLSRAEPVPPQSQALPQPRSPSAQPTPGLRPRGLPAVGVTG